MPLSTSMPRVKLPTNNGVITPPQVLQLVLRILSNIEATNGIRVTRTNNGGLKFIGSGDIAPVFPGNAYVAGIKTTGLTSDSTKPWVKCDLSTGACSEETGPPPDPFPDNEEWVEKANQHSDIHFPRG